jgi:hypothetical protein
MVGLVKLKIFRYLTKLIKCRKSAFETYGGGANTKVIEVERTMLIDLSRK